MTLKNASLLVIDDDADVLTAVRLLLKSQVRQVFTEREPANIPTLFAAGHDYDIIMLDMNFHASVNTGNEGLYWLRQLKQLGSKAAIIMITAYADVDLAVRSLKVGATDFVVKPWQNDRLIETLKECLIKVASNGAPASKAAATPALELLGQSDAMQAVFQKIEKVAPTDANILILGENGTGKDLVAKAIHDHSLRAQGPYVKVDVGALTETLFESELFGHVKGAFTDARDNRTGRFEAANGGTLFLDEIGNITLQQQSKLLTVLQNRQVIRLGSNNPVDIDIRLLCATNLPVQELAKESRFRKDLIYRINTVEIVLPPLRKRGNDIALLARHFAGLYARKYLKPTVELHPSALDKLVKYHFPGNVRELQYAIERAVIMCDGDVIRDSDILFSPIESTLPQEEETADTRLNVIERNTILKVIEKNNGNISKAAKELGLTRTALYRRLNKYDI